MSEIFAVVDEYGESIGCASRTECHGGSFLLHSVVHLLVFNSNGQIVLQKRSMAKDIQPGKWDSSVGGHITKNETVDHALAREAEEELGIFGAACEFLYTYIMKSEIEREFVSTFRCIWDGIITFQQEEIDEVRWFTPDEVDAMCKTGLLTPNFEQEWDYYHRWCIVNIN